MTKDAFQDGSQISDLINLEEGLDKYNISDLGEVLEVLEQLEVDSLTKKVKATTIDPKDPNKLVESNQLDNQNQLKDQYQQEDQNQLEGQKQLEDWNQPEDRNYLEHQNQLKDQKHLEDRKQLEDQNQLEGQKQLDNGNQLDDRNQLEELLDSFAVSPLPLPFLSDTEMQAVVEDLLEDLEDLQQDLDAILFREEERRKRVRKRAGLKKGDVIEYKNGELWFHVLVTGKGKATGKNRNYLNLMYKDGSQGGVYINKHEWRFSEKPFMPWLQKVQAERPEREAMISSTRGKEKVESRVRAEDFSLSEVSEDQEKKKKRYLEISVLNLAGEGRTLSSCKEIGIRGRKRHNSEREKGEYLRVPVTLKDEEEEVCTDGGGVVDKDREVKVNCVVVIATKSEEERGKIPGYHSVSGKRSDSRSQQRRRKSHVDRKNKAAVGLDKNSRNDGSTRHIKSGNSEIGGLEDSLSNMSIDFKVQSKNRGVGNVSFSDAEI